MADDELLRQFEGTEHPVVAKVLQENIPSSKKKNV